MKLARTPWCASLLLTLCASLAAGQLITLNAVDRGWYAHDDYHEADNPNYAVGDHRGPISNSGESDLRNFFVFDLATVEDEIYSAWLSLYMPFPNGYFSSDPFETYQLVEVSSTIRDLTDGSATHSDLGTGTVYGTYDFTNDVVGTQVMIPVNPDAIAAMNASDGLFAYGGSITTLNQYPDDEFAFGFTAEPHYLTQLILDTSNVIGDFNGDMQYDCHDVDALVGVIAAGTDDALYDLTRDALVNLDDLDAWLAEAGAANLLSGRPYLAGDASLDGAVDVTDFNHWNGSKFTQVAAWCAGSTLR